MLLKSIFNKYRLIIGVIVIIIIVSLFYQQVYLNQVYLQANSIQQM